MNTAQATSSTDNLESNINGCDDILSNFLADDIDCKYYDTSHFNSLSFPNNSLSFFHLNISSLSKHFDELQILFNSLNHSFKIIAISETRIQSSSHSITLPGYETFSTPTEAAAGGTLLFISDLLTSFPRPDLDNLMYSSRLVECRNFP